MTQKAAKGKRKKSSCYLSPLEYAVDSEKPRKKVTFYMAP